jgi:LmeA-like phospholipid-binding
MRKLLIAVIVVAGLLVAADRVAVILADRQIASRVQSAYSLPSKPSVSVTGFPFLTQVASGDYHQINVSIGSLNADGVQVNELTAQLSGVRAPLRDLSGHGSSGITAAQVTGSGTVPFSSVRSHLPRGVELSQDGEALRLAGKVSYLGVTVPVSADATLAPDGSGIAVTPTRISVASGSSALSSAIAGQFRFVVPVTGLPLHLAVRLVSVVPGGVRVGAAAADVAFAGGT